MIQRTHIFFASIFVALGVLLAAADADGWPAQLQRRLEALKPSNASEYLVLAEDVIDRAPSSPSAEADRVLAKQLASLAGALDVQGMGRSAALLLADLATSDAERLRMLALAALLDPKSDVRVEASERSEAVLALVRAFALYRRGDGIRAKEAIARGGAAALLDRHPEILKGGATRFRADCEAMRTSGIPSMTVVQVEALHSLAAGSIAGTPRSWSEAISRVGPGPLPEIDINNPRALFGIDPTLCIWRANHWSAP